MDWDASGSGAATSSSIGRLGLTTADVLGSASAGAQLRSSEGVGTGQVGDATTPMEVDAKAAEDAKAADDATVTEEAKMAEDVPQV